MIKAEQALYSDYTHVFQHYIYARADTLKIRTAPSIDRVDLLGEKHYIIFYLYHQSNSPG